jgi:hypothetical protein
MILNFNIIKQGIWIRTKIFSIGKMKKYTRMFIIHHIGQFMYNKLQ